MFSFNELRKISKQQINGQEIRIAILGNCSTQLFAKAIDGNCKAENINSLVFDADYNQIDFQLLNKDSEVYSFNPKVLILWISTEKLYEDFLILNADEKASFAENYIEKIKNYWNLIKEHSDAKIIQFNFTEIDDKALGNYSIKVEQSFIYQIRKLNYLLSESMKRESNVFPVDLLSIQVKLGTSFFFNPVLYYSSKMSVSIDALPYISEQVVKVIKSLIGRIAKCLIMDLDNTIWGGIIGDDGLDNIEIGELGTGRLFTNFQKWIKQLKEFGIILAVCSKNNEEIAKEPFKKHKDMILRLSDISLFVANWDDKATNIRMIQESLNIGMDSIVFIDDNRFERNLVKQVIPDILVPDLPDDPADYLSFLQSCNLFETSSFEGVVLDRTAQYQAQFERKKLEMSFSSIDDYLSSLEMECVAEPFQKSQLPRISQLAQRSNQFNLRTIRYSEEDVRRIANDNNYLTFSCTLKDKYGDYGLVSVVIIKKINHEIGFVETWLMSCRALKRGLEEFTVNKMIELCKKNGLKVLNSEYIPTPKNAMVKNIYLDFGFESIGDNLFSIKIDKYVTKKNYIKEV